tara:strand:+ start:18802 stop:20298 length:1497 start_codon:yes stop_codon:yes gene_type:complete
MYRLVKPRRVAIQWEGEFAHVDLIDFPNKHKSLSISNEVWCFNFLNHEQSFSMDSIDWSLEDHGMLWTYNLNYFDWLLQSGLSKVQGLETLKKFYATTAEKNPIILHPYPTSLRIINTAKFISKWGIKEGWLYYYLAMDLKFLSGRLEYHLLANHLLENAFALYIGGLITDQKKIIKKGKKLLIRELKEQVLDDGMHYERSPMYHLIILERLLDAYNFAKAVGDDLEPVLKSYAVKMTGLAINWKDLDRIPMMQDSAYDIALSVPDILEYSKRLLEQDYPSKSNDLKDSGYRSLDSGNFTLFANVGSIGPSYQPAHAHSDELSFELFNSGTPVIVDTGISTYEKDDTRFKERSSISHNCVSINYHNLSDVWAGFRVGKRAMVESQSSSDFIQATCKANKILISRNFEVVSDGFLIEDNIQSNGSLPSQGCLHLHPDVYLEKLDSHKFKVSKLIISISTDLNEVWIKDYIYCKGFNNRVPSKKLVYTLKNHAKVEFRKA